MFKKIEFIIANKYLKSKRKESFIIFISWFSLIGIALGVAVLIIVMSVMNGFRKEIVDSLIGLSGHIYISNYSNNIQDYNNVINKITPLKEIKNAFPVINQQVLFSSTSASFGGYVSGLSFANITSKPILQKSLTNTNLNSFKDNKNVIILGYKLASNLNITIGDSITLISPNGYTSLFGSVPKFGTFKVIALVNTQMYQYDSSLAILPFTVAQNFFNFNNSAQQIEIYLNNANQVENIQNNIKNYIPLYNVSSWKDSNKYLIDALVVERNVMFLILSLVILIASFNIVSGLTMLVKNKTKEISILRTIGVSENSIIKIFLLIGLRIGLTGTIVGSICGVIIALNLQYIKTAIEYLFSVQIFPQEIYFLSKLPSDVNFVQIILIVLLAISFSLIAAIYPAIKASKIKPAEGLKYD